MPIVDVERIDEDATLAEVIDAFAKLQKAFDYLMQGGLDSKNAREFGGWLVGNTELQSRDKTVGMSTEETGADDIRFWSGDVKTGSPNFKVTQAGILNAIGALIQSAAGYPRVEMNNTTNLLGVYQTANESIRIDPAGTSGDPVISFYRGGSRMGSMQYLSPDILIFTVTGVANINLSSGISLFLQATNDVRINCAFFKINGFTGQTASIPYVKNVVAGAPTFGSMNFTNGVLTSWT